MAGQGTAGKVTLGKGTQIEGPVLVIKNIEAKKPQVSILNSSKSKHLKQGSVD